MMERRPLDVYETPRQLSLAVCRFLQRPAPGRWHYQPILIQEPHCGTGSFVAAARSTWPDATILASDVRGNVRADALGAGASEFREADWLTEDPYANTFRRPDLIVGNPPFRGCEIHVDRALERVTRGGRVAFILSLNLLWPTRPKEGLWRLPGLELVQPMNPRADFLGRGGCDAVGVACFVWRRGYCGPIHLEQPLRWRGDQHKAQTALQLGEVGR